MILAKMSAKYLPIIYIFHKISESEISCDHEQEMNNKWPDLIEGLRK